MKILAVIPARGGSKGIPRKNIRLMHGKPLIYYSIQNARQCAEITDIAVDSDDEEILFEAKEYGAYPIRRPPDLAKDSVTLDPVVSHAVCQMEALNNTVYDIVITLQVTSPLLKASTLTLAIQEFLKDGAETYISAVNKPHLAWSERNGQFLPLYEKRMNRQQLPPYYLEAGAFLITRREFVTDSSRLGKNISVHQISELEAIDIDTPEDWIICENIMGRKKIVFRADGYREIGMGHIYHCLTLAYHLIGHDVLFVSDQEHREGFEKLSASHFPLQAVCSDQEFYDLMEKVRPDMIVNDRLDTEPDYIKNLKRLCSRVVTIEDMGEGANYADAVVNALYETDDVRNPNLYCGSDYVCLRDEFLLCCPRPFRSEVREVLVIFGGTDPCNLTKKIYGLAREGHPKYPDIHFTFLLGIGYCDREGKIVTRADENIAVVQDAKMVSRYMREADLAFTSQGRTVYELASLGIPSIVLAQNEREQLHTFAQMGHGFLNLGLGNKIEMDTLEKTFAWMTNTPQIREEMRNLMLHHNLKNGIQREIKVILGE